MRQPGSSSATTSMPPTPCRTPSCRPGSTCAGCATRTVFRRMAPPPPGPRLLPGSETAPGAGGRGDHLRRDAGADDPRRAARAGRPRPARPGLPAPVDRGPPLTTLGPVGVAAAGQIPRETPWTWKPVARAAVPSSSSCVANTSPSTLSRTSSALARWMASREPKAGRKGLGCALEHDRIQRDQAERVDCLEHVCSIARDLPIGQAEADAGSIDRAEAFEPDQLARDRVGDRWPDLKSVRLAQDDAEEDRGVDVDVQRSRRSSRRSSVDGTGQLAGTRRRSRISGNSRPGWSNRTCRPGGGRGTIRAIARFRSMTRTSAPLSTARRCSDRRSLSSPILTRFMARYSHNRPDLSSAPGPDVG